MKVIDLLNSKQCSHAFSIEVLPPLKGNGTDILFRNLDKMREMQPLFVNITTHHSEYVYHELPDGQFSRQKLRRRPGTIAIAAAIQRRYGYTVIPHVICSGATAEDIEYELIDLQFLGIDNLLLLRGDKAKDDKVFTPEPGGYAHTTQLIEQVDRFNQGFFVDGSVIKHPGAPFHFGVAAYPEKHEEAPNMDMDMSYLKRKQDLGADYAVTQMFFDNAKYFDFVKKAREKGITIPIIPGIKPFSKRSQLTMVPKTFHLDLPQELAREAVMCHTDDDARTLGVEWAVHQCRELFAAGVRDIHFYTMSAVDSVVEVARQLM